MTAVTQSFGTFFTLRVRLTSAVQSSAVALAQDSLSAADRLLPLPFLPCHLCLHLRHIQYRLSWSEPPKLDPGRLPRRYDSGERRRPGRAGPMTSLTDL